jgi:hypothetical protein
MERTKALPIVQQCSSLNAILIGLTWYALRAFLEESIFNTVIG